MKILAIETSCDETSAALVEGKPISQSTNELIILSNIVSSQIDLHKKYGGIVPEVASRAQVESIWPVFIEATSILNSKSLILKEVDVLAVTTGPGLIGSLLVGVNFAKTLAYSLKKPIVPVNHLEGHIYANFVRVTHNSKLKTQNSNIKFPILCLIVSGGHTSLVLMKNHLNYKIIGQTLDDAAGESFDKVGKLLGISYPAGLEMEILAKSGNPKAFTFPRPMIDSKDFNLSFSGLKTAVLYEVSKLKAKSSKLKADISASFQQAVIDVLVAKTIKAAKKYKVKTIMLAGGVAANEFLRKELLSKSLILNPKSYFIAPPKNLCTDNAAMIGAAAYYKIKKFGLKKYNNWQKINANANLKLK